MLTNKKIKSYTSEPYHYSSYEILDRGFSFSPQSHRQILLPEVEYKSLSTFINKKTKGFEPGSADYITFGENYFVRISEMNDNNFTFSESGQTKKLLPQKKDTKLVYGDLCYQTASNVGNVCFYNGRAAYYNSHILKLEIKNEDKYYIFGILKSSYNKEQVDLGGSIKGLDNFSEEFLNNTMIPLPKKEEVKILVSLIVQNIIDKEQQIKAKNEQINNTIKEELETHSHPDIRMPVSNEILENNFRFDSGLYSPEYKRIKGSIEFYEGGYFNLLDHYNAKRGQNLQVSNIGISIYSNEKKNNFYRLVTKEDFNNRSINKVRYLGNKNKLDILKGLCIIMNATGVYAGDTILFDSNSLDKTITNINQWVITPKQKKSEKTIFTSCFLGFLHDINYFNIIKDISNGGMITNEHLKHWIKIPNFPEELQKDIAIKYHNVVEENKNLTLDTYLEKEKERNNLLGIWQLNIELFTLKEQLEQLVHNIVYNEEIDILSYL